MNKARHIIEHFSDFTPTKMINYLDTYCDCDYKRVDKNMYFTFIDCSFILVNDHISHGSIDDG